ncbi:hypothetical protein Tco_0431657 [Tanacetum coccineum]
MEASTSKPVDTSRVKIKEEPIEDHVEMLKNVFEGDDVSDIDWCSYILECASESKLDWSKTRKKKDVVYYGPMMFFMKSRRGIQMRDTRLMKKREDLNLKMTVWELEK